MNITIRSLQYFSTAAEMRSISKAADALHISQSSIASAINSLELAMGVKLVERQRSKGLTVTSAGKSALRRAKHVINEFDGFLNNSASLQESLSGYLQLGYHAPIAPAFIPEIIRPLMEADGKVTINLIACDDTQVQAQLLNGEIDIGIFMDYSIHSDIKVVKLMEIPLYVLLPKGHKLCEKKKLTFLDLHKQDMVLLNLPMTIDYYQTIISTAGIKPNIVATANTTEMVRSMVSEGYGISLLNMQPNSNITYTGKEVVARPLVENTRTLNLVLGSLQTNPSHLINEFARLCIEYTQSEQSNKHRVII